MGSLSFPNIGEKKIKQLFYNPPGPQTTRGVQVLKQYKHKPIQAVLEPYLYKVTDTAFSAGC